VRADGSGLRRLSRKCTVAGVQASRCADESGPAWSPDGRHLLINSAIGSDVDNWIENSEIAVVDADGGHKRMVTRLTGHRGDIGNAVWSPDGRRVLFEKHPKVPEGQASRSALFVVDAKGGTPKRVTHWGLKAGDHPDWSPDGSRILFRSQPNGDDGTGGDLFVARPDGTGRRQLTRNNGNERAYSASFSPDARWIVFSYSGVDGEPDVWIMRADGTAKRQLTRTPVWDSAPDWGPDR
jgi:TolB protein